LGPDDLNFITSEFGNYDRECEMDKLNMFLDPIDSTHQKEEL
jgi:hypothetical protein